MKEIYRHQDPTRVGYYKSVLEDAGIICFIRNQYADSAALGSGSIPQLFPALCITDDNNLEPARQLLASHEYSVAEAGEDWVCPNCQEEVPGEFSACWNCQTVIDPGDDSEAGDDV